MSRGQSGFVVVTEATRAPVLDGLPVLSADEYLENRGDALAEDLVIINLCRSYQYRSKGYYVSLLADARHQRVFPTLKMIEEIRNPATYLRILQEAGVAIADARTVRELRRNGTRSTPAADMFAAPALAGAASEDGWRGRPRTAVGSNGGGGQGGNGNGNGHGSGCDNGHETQPTCAEIWCVFGKTGDDRFRRHCAAVFETYAFPLLKIRVYRAEGTWKVGQLAPAGLHQLDPAGLDLLVRELTRPHSVLPRRAAANGPRPHRIACLWDPEDPLAASDRDTLDRFARAAARRGVLFERIGREDLPRLAEFDALFIRTVTAIDHFSFTFAQAAESLGIPVIDDPQSIVKCSNKVYLQELFRRNGIPTPRTVTVSRKTPFDEVRALGFPLIVKLPDGTFSQAVKKADDPPQFEAISQEMFRSSPLLIVQEFIPTPFDWRIGVLAGRILFTCKYHMAHGHWQIVSLGRSGEREFGQVEAVPAAAVPEAVRALALESTSLLGAGLYGVDVKETPAGPVVIEINDNPNIQVGCEDSVEKDRVYEALVDTFLARLGSRVPVLQERT
jgi:glutathione synthase/RimK-type ligase-like ATP-grasp enzyme